MMKSWFLNLHYYELQIQRLFKSKTLLINELITTITNNLHIYLVSHFTVDQISSKQVLTHVPPHRASSTTAAFTPNSAARLAVARPPDPPPNTNKSNFLTTGGIVANDRLKSHFKSWNQRFVCNLRNLWSCLPIAKKTHSSLPCNNFRLWGSYLSFNWEWHPLKSLRWQYK